jgi:CPA1 family monovalent cation:H+ antiporter
MNGFDLAALFLTVVAVAGWINARFLRLPTATIMVLAGLASGAILLVGQKIGSQPNAATALVRLVAAVDFPRAVLSYMLAFLLFAGSSQVNLAELKKRGLAIVSLATIGVAVSTTLIGLGFWLAARAGGIALPMAWAFVFGALISPTDPIAVLAAVREGSLSKALQAVLQGEALFNDGVGIVVFTAAVLIASQGGRLDIQTASLQVLFRPWAAWRWAPPERSWQSGRSARSTSMAWRWAFPSPWPQPPMPALRPCISAALSPSSSRG